MGAIRPTRCSSSKVASSGVITPSRRPDAARLCREAGTIAHGTRIGNLGAGWPASGRRGARRAPPKSRSAGVSIVDHLDLLGGHQADVPHVVERVEERPDLVLGVDDLDDERKLGGK